MTVKSTISVPLVALGLMLVPATAHAQFGAMPFSDPATGERYRIEGSGSIWNPPPELTVASAAGGIPGTEIDLVNDLGIAQRRLGELRLVLRPGRKHKLRMHYLPMTYTAEQKIPQTLVFNGERYPAGTDVATTFEWNAWRFGYEYDFLYHDRWFVGFLLDVKYTDISLDLQNLQTPITEGSSHGRGPIPTIGGIVRVYALPNVSITGEFTGLKIPDSFDEDYRTEYFDFDVYGTVNFNDYVGAQIGYRSIDVEYKIEADTGAFLLKGWYFGGVVRY